MKPPLFFFMYIIYAVCLDREKQNITYHVEMKQHEVHATQSTKAYRKHTIDYFLSMYHLAMRISNYLKYPTKQKIFRTE